MVEFSEESHFSPPTRRNSGSATGSASANANGPSSRSDKNSIKVVVWDEQQPAQKEAYETFLGNQIAAHLKTQEGLAVQSVKLDDPE